MNKLILPLAMASFLGIFNAYPSLAQSHEKTTQTEKHVAKQQKTCSTETKDCCKGVTAKPGNCCACCTGSTCAAAGKHCCG